MPSLLQKILEVSCPPGLPGVIFVGPYGERVSFASQQKRAINTILALQGENRLPPSAKEAVGKPPHIGIIGAGLAGITAATLLLDLGFKVTLFEKHEHALEKQALAKHRYVHPSVNFWPFDDFRPSTDLPVFNWIEGGCVDVTLNLLKQWNRVKAIYENRSLKFQGNTAVLRARQAEPRADSPPPPVFLDYLEADGNQKSSPPFNLVLATTGFGEDVAGGTVTLPSGDKVVRYSYWKPDGLDRFIDTDIHVTVVGTGDGGLIDFFRLILQNFDDGMMCLELIRDLDVMPDLVDAIRVEDASIKNRFKTGNSNESSEAYFELYSRLAADRAVSDLIENYLPIKKLRARLEREPLYWKGRRAYVQLMGQFTYPFDHNTASIHKLLMAKVLNDNAKAFPDLYKQVNYSAERRSIEVPGGWEGVKGEIIERLGANPPMRMFIMQIGRTDLEDKLAKEPDNDKRKKLEDQFAKDRQRDFNTVRADQSVIGDVLDINEVAPLQGRLVQLMSRDTVRYDKTSPAYLNNYKDVVFEYLNRDVVFTGNAAVSIGKISKRDKSGNVIKREAGYIWRVDRPDLERLFGEEFGLKLPYICPETIIGVPFAQGQGSTAGLPYRK